MRDPSEVLDAIHEISAGARSFDKLNIKGQAQACRIFAGLLRWSMGERNDQFETFMLNIRTINAGIASGRRPA